MVEQLRSKTMDSASIAKEIVGLMDLDDQMKKGGGEIKYKITVKDDELKKAIQLMKDFEKLTKNNTSADYFTSQEKSLQNLTRALGELEKKYKENGGKVPSLEDHKDFLNWGSAYRAQGYDWKKVPEEIRYAWEETWASMQEKYNYNTNFDQVFPIMRQLQNYLENFQQIAPNWDSIIQSAAKAGETAGEQMGQRIQDGLKKKTVDSNALKMHMDSLMAELEGYWNNPHMNEKDAKKFLGKYFELEQLYKKYGMEMPENMRNFALHDILPNYGELKEGESAYDQEIRYRKNARVRNNRKEADLRDALVMNNGEAETFAKLVNDELGIDSPKIASEYNKLFDQVKEGGMSAQEALQKLKETHEQLKNEVATPASKPSEKKDTSADESIKKSKEAAAAAEERRKAVEKANEAEAGKGSTPKNSSAEKSAEESKRAAAAAREEEEARRRLNDEKSKASPTPATQGQNQTPEVAALETEVETIDQLIERYKKLDAEKAKMRELIKKVDGEYKYDETTRQNAQERLQQINEEMTTIQKQGIDKFKKNIRSVVASEKAKEQEKNVPEKETQPKPQKQSKPQQQEKPPTSQPKQQQTPQPSAQPIPQPTPSPEKIKEAAKATSELNDELQKTQQLQAGGTQTPEQGAIPSPQKIEESIAAIKNIKDAWQELQTIYNEKGEKGLKDSLAQLNNKQLASLIRSNNLQQGQTGLSRATHEERVDMALRGFHLRREQEQKNPQPSVTQGDTASLEQQEQKMEQTGQKAEEVKSKAEEAKSKAEEAKQAVDDANKAVNEIGSSSGGSGSGGGSKGGNKSAQSLEQQQKDLENKISQYKKLGEEYIRLQKTIEQNKKQNGGQATGIDSTIGRFTEVSSQMEQLKSEIQQMKSLSEELSQSFNIIDEAFQTKKGMPQKGEFDDINTGYQTLIDNMSKYVELTNKMNSGKDLTFQQQQWMSKYKDQYRDAFLQKGLFDDKNKEALDAAQKFREEYIKLQEPIANTMVDQLGASLEKLSEGDWSKTGVSNLQKFKTELENIKTDLSNLKTQDGKIININGLDSAIAKLRALSEETRNFSGDKYNKLADPAKVAGLNRQMEEWKFNNSAATGAIQQITQLQSSLDGISAGGLKDVYGEFERIKASAAQAGTLGKSFGDSLKKSFMGLGRYLATYTSFYRVIGTIKSAVNMVKELDTALMEVRKVAAKPLSELKEWQKGTFEQADEVGTTGKQLQQSTAAWLRLGKSFSESQEAAKASSWLLNVSEFKSIDDATTALVSMKQAYNDLSFEDIIDKLNNVGDHFSSATDQLASGLQNAGAVLKTQGNDIDKSLALLTAGKSLPDSMETYFKYIFNCVERLKTYSTIAKKLRYQSLIIYVYDG